MSTEFKTEDVYMDVYNEDDGVRNMTDSFIIGLLDRSERDGTMDMFFFGDTNPDKKVFLSRVKYESRLMFFTILYKGDIAGFGLVDDIRDDTGQGHFCVFSEYWNHEASIFATREVYKRLLAGQFSVITGIVPEDNKFAIQFCKKTGLEELAIIPKRFKKDGQHIKGVMFCAERGVF